MMSAVRVVPPTVTVWVAEGVPTTVEKAVRLVGVAVMVAVGAALQALVFNRASVAVSTTAVRPVTGFTVFAPLGQVPSASEAQPTKVPSTTERCSTRRTPLGSTLGIRVFQSPTAVV